MNKKIAVITGASGGLGKEFTSLMLKESLDEIWCIARNKDKLEPLIDLYGNKIIILPYDLSNKESLYLINERLKSQTATVLYLINNAGIGEVLGAYVEGDFNNCNNIISLNCSALVGLCNICIPYMNKGAKIINISSQSSFQPVPYLNIYAATKAFVTNYTRGLNVELKPRGISATAVCAGWTKTPMLPQKINNKSVKYPGIVAPEKVAYKALKDAKAGKDMSVCTVYVKWMRLMSKIFPHSCVMKIWVTSIRKYL